MWLATATTDRSPSTTNTDVLRPLWDSERVLGALPSVACVVVIIPYELKEKEENNSLCGAFYVRAKTSAQRFHPFVPTRSLRPT